MNREEKIKLLIEYIKSNVGAILVDFISYDVLPAVAKIDARCDINELNGHYEKDKFVAPKWYKKIIDEEGPSILVIENIDSIAKEEQYKFIEIIKYRKVSTFELPEDCIIILTATKISKETIDEELYSLVANIEG